MCLIDETAALRSKRFSIAERNTGGIQLIQKIENKNRMLVSLLSDVLMSSKSLNTPSPMHKALVIGRKYGRHKHELGNGVVLNGKKF